MFGLLKIFFRFYNRFFSPDKIFAKRLRSLVGFTPSNLGIFKLAFYHKSASSEKLYAVQSNERLEYLGDAVLGTIVAEYLFKKYPNQDEGFLTKMRSKIVKRQSLNKIADKMGLDVFLNQYNNTRLSRSMLGNALEALVGAVYIECGYRKTRQYVVQKILRGYLDIHELESFDDNYKSQLLEWCQKNGQTVSYKMLAKYKFEKRDRFKVAVLIDGKKLAVADDFNKKSAEQTASEKAMQLLGLLTEADKDKNKKEQHPRSTSLPDNRRRNNDRNNKQQGSNSRRPNPKGKKENPRLAAGQAQRKVTKTENNKTKAKPSSKLKQEESKSNNQRRKTQKNNPRKKPTETEQKKSRNQETNNTSNPSPNSKENKSETSVAKEQKRNKPKNKPRPKKTETEQLTEQNGKVERGNQEKKSPSRIQKKTNFAKQSDVEKEIQEHQSAPEVKKSEDQPVVKLNTRKRPPRKPKPAQKKEQEIGNEEDIEIEIPVDFSTEMLKASTAVPPRSEPNTGEPVRRPDNDTPPA